jgi:aspartate/methionine/tyrosine aminotransferase
MTSPIGERLARRVRGAPHPSNVEYDGVPVDDALRACLARHLAAGETHYTTRPGMVPLRRRIATLLVELGGPPRAEDGVVVTAGEGESLYVTLLSLEIGPGAVVASVDPGPHRLLFDLMDIRLVRPSDANATGASATFTRLGTGHSVSESAVGCSIVAMGSGLASGGDNKSLIEVADDALILGDLNGFAGLDHFHLGFVAGPPDRIKRVMTWKQALSICTAAPSQRAALFSLGDGSP